MKIAIVCFNLQWQAGGSRLIFSLAQGLMGRGHKVVIYAPEVNPQAFPELQRGLDIRVVPQPRPLKWTENPTGLMEKILHKTQEERAQVRTAKLIAAAMEDDFDVVNVHDFAYRVGLFYKKRNRKARIIWTENDPPFSYLPKSTPLRDVLSRAFNGLKEFTERKYFRAIDRVVVLDFYNRGWALRHGLKPTVVRSGVDFKNFYTPVRPINPALKRIRILGIGALNKYRRFEDIVQAVHLLRSWGYDARALVICKDIWGEAAYRQFLIDLVRHEKLGEAVDFRFEGVSNEELRRAYRESDVFVLSIYLPPPRNGYGWGLANFEAMAAGLPLVICRTSTAMEVLRDGEHALAVEPMNPEDIAAKVRSLMDNADRYRRIAVAGQELVRDTISWEKYANDMLAVFTI